MKRTRVDDLHNKWMKNPKYRREYEALEEEFSLTAALDRKSTRLNSSHPRLSRMPSSA